MKRYDLIVIGAGPGGYTAALQAARLKKSVLLLEMEKVGGTCLNRGCIPTKALLRAARLYRETKEGAALGISADGVRYDMAAMCRRAAEVEDHLRQGILSELRRSGVTLLSARGRILSGHIVEAGAETYEAENVLAAAGSVPALPPIPGLELGGVYTSDSFLTGSGIDCHQLLIVGGGVIGVEFAQIYSDLGAEVTVVEALPRLLPEMDRELGQSLALHFKKRGIHVYTWAPVQSFSAGENGLLGCTFSDRTGTKTLEAEAVLVCTGRKPAANGLFAPELEAQLKLEKGRVPVDAQGRTGAKGLWAVGDLAAGGPQLAHAAEAQAAAAVGAMFGVPAAKDCSMIPACIFTEPEIAVVGLDAEAAKAKNIEFTVRKKLSTSNGKALIEGADRGFAKLLCRAGDGVLLGAQLFCPHASELIGGLAAAIRAGLTEEEFERTVFPHPTVSEVLVS